MKQFAIGLDSNDERVQVITQDGNHLCYIEQDPVWEYAHLIAAAPKLYEFCEELLSALDAGYERLGAGREGKLRNLITEGREQ